MATRKEVAKLAGVSAATVSYYLNDTGYVGKQTREKIARAIEELNFSVGIGHRSRNAKERKKLLYICNEIRNPFHAQVAYMATMEAYRQGYTLHICNYIEDEAYIRELCQSEEVSGVLVSSPRLKDSFYEFLAENAVPTVVVEDRPEKMKPFGISRIVIQYEEVMLKLIDCLIGEKKTRLCYISSTNSEDPEKMDGKTYAVLSAADKRSSDIKVQVIGSVVHAEDAYKVVLHYCQGSDPYVDAFLCTNDAVAMGVQRAIYELSSSRAKEILVIGSDDTFLSKFLMPSLTSVGVELDQIGTQGIQMLISKCHKQPVEDYYIFPEIRHREKEKECILPDSRSI